MFFPAHTAAFTPYAQLCSYASMCFPASSLGSWMVKRKFELKNPGNPGLFVWGIGV